MAPIKLLLIIPLTFWFYTFVGYRSQEIPVGKNSIINVQMEKDILALDFSKGNRFDIIESKSNNQQKANTGNEKAEVYVAIEEMPGYPGGTDALLQFLQSNLKYPEDARIKGIEGEVLVSYTINEQGEVTDAKILRGISPEIDKEALRITNSIKGWKPATQDGNSISMVVNMPIEFRIKK
jgi:TonB family protein